MGQTRFTGPVLSDAGFILHNLGGNVGAISWNPTIGCAEITMPNGVTLQVGMEQFMPPVENATGADIPNGSVVAFAGVNGYLKGVPFAANGSMPPLYVMGVATTDILNGGIGYVTTFGEVHDIDTTGGPVGETWAKGDLLYANPAYPGKMTNSKPTSPSAVIVVAAVLHVGVADGVILVRPTITMHMNSGDFIRTTNQDVAAINTAYALEFTSAQSSIGVTIGTPASRIVVDDSGLYRLSCSLQVSSASANAKTLRGWFRKNGTDLPNTARLVSIQINGGYTTILIEDTVSLAANDYIELCYAGDSTDLALNAVAATGYAPGAPSAKMSVNQIQL